MDLNAYYWQILVPANVAVSALRRAGLPVDLVRLRATRAVWQARLKDLESFVEGEAAKVGVSLHYSSVHSTSPKAMQALLYQGLGLPVRKRTAPTKTFPDGQPSTDDEALIDYGSVAVPRAGDHPVVSAMLKIRSLAKGIGTYLNAFERECRSDGCVHPHFKWNLRTPRLAAENPPVHQIPEKSDKEVADGIKSCFVPRQSPAPTPEEWDPRIHGSCVRWDISGAEAAIRAAMLTHRFCSRPDPVAYDYIRLGKDIHSKTASLIYRKPEGTYTKGMYERDAVGKQAFFAKIYGANWRTVQSTILTRSRIRLSDAEAQKISSAFDAGYSGLTELYEWDKRFIGDHGYCEDGYGRRRWIGLPDQCRYAGITGSGLTLWDVAGRIAPNRDDLPRDDRLRRTLWGQLEHAFHMAANSPTQGMSATDTLWMLALLYHGEYVDLAVPPMWADRGVLYPEAAGWKLHEGPGPRGKPFLAWHTNTVHDSAWPDCAPGYLEPLMKVLVRRCTAVPFDWRLEADVPYRIDIQAGPDFGNLEDYNIVAARFGLEPMPRLT